SQSAWVIEENPWPLQAFSPLQELFAPLQSLWPLHEFTPSQWILAAWAAAGVATVIPNIPAAAAARAIPVSLLAFMYFLQVKIEANPGNPG
ncbi:MAG: hypothetical protein ABI630_09260, partial [Betaproteobacteria bacterium]